MENKPLSSTIKEGLINRVSTGGTVKSFLIRYCPGFSRAHFYRELRKDLPFAAEFAFAREIGASIIADEILTIVDDETIPIDSRRLRAKVRLKLLSCWWPKKYRPASRK